MFNLFKKKPKSEPDRHSIVPRIKHKNMLPAIGEMNVPPDELPITEHLVGDLLVAYAFDPPGMFQMFKESDLQRLGRGTRRRRSGARAHTPSNKLLSGSSKR